MIPCDYEIKDKDIAKCKVCGLVWVRGASEPFCEEKYIHQTRVITNKLLLYIVLLLILLRFLIK